MAGFSSTFSASSSSLLVLFFLIGFASANDVLVGGKTDAWKIPSESDSLNKWASKARFQVGDNLVWKYDGEKDSVLEVSKEDYTNCNTTNPIKKYNDGNTKVELSHPGPFYFISGAKGHCEKGEKVIVVVISPRGERHSGSSSPALAPSPADQSEDGTAGPAVAPSPHSSAVDLKGGFVMAMFGVFAIWGF